MMTIKTTRFFCSLLVAFVCCCTYCVCVFVVCCRHSSFVCVCSMFRDILKHTHYSVLLLSIPMAHRLWQKKYVYIEHTVLYSSSSRLTFFSIACVYARESARSVWFELVAHWQSVMTFLCQQYTQREYAKGSKQFFMFSFIDFASYFAASWNNLFFATSLRNFG